MSMNQTVGTLLRELVQPVTEGHGIMDFPTNGYQRETIGKKPYETHTSSTLTLGQLVEYVGKRGFDVQFVDDVYKVADHGKWAAALLGKNIRVALKVGNYRLNEADLMAAIGHELGHAYRGKSELEAQTYAHELFEREFPHYAAKLAVENATENLGKAGELN